MLKFLPQNCVFYQTEIHGTETVKKCIKQNNTLENNTLMTHSAKETRQQKCKERELAQSEKGCEQYRESS